MLGSGSLNFLSTVTFLAVFFKETRGSGRGSWRDGPVPLDEVWMRGEWLLGT